MSERWYPKGAQSCYDRPPVGRLIAVSHKVWRVIDYREVEEEHWTDADRAAAESGAPPGFGPGTTLLAPNSNQARRRLVSIMMPPASPSESTPTPTAQHRAIYAPSRWRRLWALYSHMNEHARAEYDRFHPSRALRPWNEQVLLGQYQRAFPASRRAA